jgi:hypothetical protein
MSIEPVTGPNVMNCGSNIFFELLKIERCRTLKEMPPAKDAPPVKTLIVG